MGTAVRPAPLLLVDDDPAVRTALKFALELDGYEVETFADAESLAACPQLPADGCLVVDPVFTVGSQMVEVLRRRAVRLPALLITTHPTAMVRSRAQAAGVDIVEKPLLAEALGEALNRVLSAPPPQH